MSRKKKSELAFEIVQRTDCPENRNFVAVNNPQNDVKKLRKCNLISEADCKKFTDALSEAGELEKSCFRVHSGDMKKNKETGAIEPELEHIHMALLFKTPYTFEKVSQKFQEITGKVVPPSCVCSCTYADITSSKPSDAEQYALMVTYQTHAGKKGACNELLTPWLSNDAKDIPYQLYSLPHSASWVDENTGETKQETFEELRFIPACNPVPEGGKTICSFTSEKSKVHQNLYDPDTLNVFNTDVAECFEIYQNISQLEKDKADARQLRKEVEEVLIKIRNGEIPEYKYEMEVPPEIDVQMKNGQVANAYNYYYNKIKAEMRAMGFKNTPAKNVFFIEGGAGTGKSTYAQMLCENAKDENGNPKPMSYYVTSTGNHAFDDYQGQEVIILDDARDSSYRLNELLKMLDNNTRCDIQARYHNKNLCAVKLIIITSAKPFMEWYQEGYDKGEQIGQLYRRVKIHFELKKLPDGTCSCIQRTWNKSAKRYDVTGMEIFNPNYDEIFAEEDSDTLSETAMNLMRGGMDGLGIKHWSVKGMSVPDTTCRYWSVPNVESSPATQPASAPSTVPSAQPQYSIAETKPADNSLPVPNSQAGHSAQSESEWANITPDSDNITYKRTTIPEEQLSQLGYDYIKDENGDCFTRPAPILSNVSNTQPKNCIQKVQLDVYSPEWCKNRPPFYFDNAGRRFRLPRTVKEVEEAMRGMFGQDYIKDEYGITYIFDDWTDGESLNTFEEQLPTF